MGGFPALQLQTGVPAPAFAQPTRNAPNLQADADKEEIERLRREAELYKAYAPDWNLYLAAYEGGSDIATESNLFKHQRENDEDFLDRVKRVHYMNYCEPLVDFFTNFIFAETIHRDAGDNQDWYNQFNLDVDRRGSTVDTYMRSVSDEMQIFGMSYTLVDSPKQPENVAVVTKQTEKDQNIRPYWCLIHPEEIIDWIVDDYDNFSYVKRRQKIERLLGKNKQLIERYTEWFTVETVISEIDVTDPLNPKLLPLVDKIPNALNGLIPINVIRYKRSKRHPHMGNSFLRDFAYNNREIMNITSLLQEFLYRQCFNQLAKEVETSIPTASQEDGVFGTANVIEYPKGAKAPEYISPPSEPAKFLQEERQRIQQEMFRRAAQDTLNELFNGEGASGFSQAQSFSKTVPFIASRADILEKAEASLIAMTLKYIGKEWNGKIKYKDRYEITNITDAITQLVSLGRDLFLPSKTFVIEEMKRLVQEYDGKITPDMMQTIKKEIDGLDFPEWQNVQKQAMIGQDKPEGTSPVARGKSKSKGTTKEAAGKATQS